MGPWIARAGGLAAAWALGLVLPAPGGAQESMPPSEVISPETQSAPAPEPASGYLFRRLAGDTLERDYGIIVHGWAQGGLLYNDEGGDGIFPNAFFNSEEGFNLNQLTLAVERRAKTSVIPRVGPLPGEMPQDYDFGFNVNFVYGKDSNFFVTYGLDDQWEINKDNLPPRRNGEGLTFTQWYLEAYAPWLGGVDLIAGSWFTPIGNEIGYPFDPPDGFYTHSYAFTHEPAKHVGGLASVKWPIAPSLGLFSTELGIVVGWNNLKDNNSDPMFITNARWRSPDTKTSVDFESIFGNNRSRPGTSDQRPFTAVTEKAKFLWAYENVLTLSHRFLDDKLTATVEGIYGYQEGGDVASDRDNPPGFLITKDSDWYGVNASLLWRFHPEWQAGLRGEWFRDPRGAHFLFNPGTYYAVTANVAWEPSEFVRIRPEIRYDWADLRSNAKAFGGDLTGQPPTVNQQFIFGLDVTLTF